MVGISVGILLGKSDGVCDGPHVGILVGDDVVGSAEGVLEGVCDGVRDGPQLGIVEGKRVGVLVVGTFVGLDVVGHAEGEVVGGVVGLRVGLIKTLSISTSRELSPSALLTSVSFTSLFSSV